MSVKGKRKKKVPFRKSKVRFCLGKFHAEEIQICLVSQCRTNSALASETEGLVFPLVHLVCGNICADLSYFFISEKPLRTTLFFLLPWLHSPHFLQ